MQKLYLYSVLFLSIVSMTACGGSQSSRESLKQSSTIKSWEFDPHVSDEQALALLAAQLIGHSQFEQFFYVESGYAGAHKRIDAQVSPESIVLVYAYHPRGDAAASYYSKSSVTYPVQVVREPDESFIYLQSPSEFSQVATQGELIVTETDAFANKSIILNDAQKIFQSLSITALQRRIDGEGIQKFLQLDPAVVALEVYVSTGCEVEVNSAKAAVCEFENVFYEAWISSQGEGAILAIDFYQDYVVRGADALALDRALLQLEQAQENMLNTLNLPLAE